MDYRRDRSDGVPRPRAARPRAVLLGLAVASVAACSPEDSSREPWGKASAAARCVVCHSLEKNGPFRVAPNLWNIVGAPKGRDRAWYSYSPGLLALGGTWTPEELDRFLENPARFAPGTRMNIRVTDAAERAEIIELLAGRTD